MALVTQSFGRENEYRRVLVMILSFYAQSSEAMPTYLFTDNPDWFRKYLSEFPIHYILLTPEKIKVMRGSIDFLHRMKIALIEEAFDLSESNLFYADSDTFFLSDPMPVFQEVAPDKSFMHVWEYRFEYLKAFPMPGGKTFRAFVDLIENQIFALPDRHPLKVSLKDVSWNAGVMVLHQSHRALLPAVYSLTEQFYPRTGNHASEQYAFSIMLQKNTTLQPCEEVIYHYWYHIKKNIADLLFPAFCNDIEQLTREEKLRKVRQLTLSLPRHFKEHELALKDQAVQCFNERKFGSGYKWAWKAFRKGAVSDRVFVCDVLYHTKQWLLPRR